MLLTQEKTSGVHTVLGSSWLPAWFLSALAPALDRGMRIHWIDVGNRFDAYGLGRTARDLGFDPMRILRRIQIVRPFNVFQLDTILGEKLPAMWRGEPVVLSDPLAPFLDEDLPAPEARRMLPRVWENIRQIPAMWTVLAVSRQVSREREYVLESFLNRSDRWVSLADHEGPMSLSSLGLPLTAMA